MDLHVYNTLILSDLHLGAETSHAREATRVLKQNRFQRLILLGDIFADLNFARLTKDHWKFLGYIRKLSNPKRNIEVVWVEGNHDHGLTNIMSHLVGVRVYQDYAWEYCGLRHIAIHGHQFDGFQVNRVRLSQWGTSLYLRLQKMDLKGKPVARLIDRLNTRWLRMSPKVSAGALAYAAQHGAVNRIFCRAYPPGHSRATGRYRLLQLGRVGRFTRLTYLQTIDKQGVKKSMSLMSMTTCELEYGKRVDDRDSGEERGETYSALADLADESGLLEDVEYENISS